MSNKSFISGITGSGGNSSGTGSTSGSGSTSSGTTTAKGLFSFLKKKIQEKQEQARKPMSQMGDTSYTPASEERYNSSTPMRGLGSTDADWRRRSREVNKWDL